MSRETPARARLLTLPPRQRTAFGARVRVLLEATGRPLRRPVLRTLLDAVADYDEHELWLTLAVLHGELPTPSHVRRLRRSRELDGGWGALDQLLEDMPRRRADAGPLPPVTVVTDRVLLDVTGLLPDDDVAPGRGAGRQLVREWARSERVVPVTWGGSRRWLRELDADERAALGIHRERGRVFGTATTALVPHRAPYVAAGAVQLPRSAERLIALGEASDNPSGSVGYGLGPLLHADRHPRQDGEARFSWHLAAQRSFDRLAVLGAGDVTEYTGWKRMLTAVGRPGPELVGFALPSDGDGLTGTVTAPTATGAWAGLATEIGEVVGIR